MARRIKRQEGTKTVERTDLSSTFNATDLKAQLLHRPAIKAVIWGIPAMNGDLHYLTTFDDVAHSKRRKR